MNREIKFRVWDIPNNCFIPNDCYVLSNDGRSLGMMVKDWNNYKIGEHMYSPNQTLSQFTGLLDKNGKDIYEGDIVLLNHWKSSDLFNYKLPFIVEYYEGEINFKQKEYNNFKGSLVGKIDIEIIGNQFENPELL